MFERILKNSSYLLIAQAVTKVISFFYTLFLARSLGVENFGLLVVALSYFSLFSSFSDFGINQYLVREGSVDKSKLSTLLINSIILRTAVILVAFFIFALILFFTDPDKLRLSLSLLGVLAVLPQGAALTIDSVFIALQKLSFSAAGILILSLSTTLTGIFLISKGFSSVGAISAVGLGEVVYGLSLFLLLKKIKVNLMADVSLGIIKKIVSGSFPYGVLVVLGLLYFKIDSIILNYLKGAYDTGIYGAGYKFLEALIFVPSALSTALFPVLANLSANEPKKIYQLYLKTSLALLGISLIIVVAYLLVLPEIITLFLPQYLPSIAVIKILAYTIPFLFMISPQAVVLLSHRKYLNQLIVISIFNLFLNVFLNFLLIPKYSYVGSSVVTVVSDVVSFLIFFIYIKVQFHES